MNKALVSLAALGTLSLAASAQAGVIFSDDFDATVGNTINATAPDVRPGSETWTSTADTAFAAGGHAGMVNAARSAYLSFTPVAGNIYELSVDVRLNSTSGGIATLGFFDNRITTTTSPNAGSPNDVRTPWLGLRNNGGALLRDKVDDGQGFADKTTAVETSTIKASDAPLTWKWNTLKLVLDTTGTDWTLAGYVTDTTDTLVQVGTTHTYVGNGGLNAVTSVGFSSIAGTTIQYDNFLLNNVVPEPASLALLALGALAMLPRRSNA